MFWFSFACGQNIHFLFLFSYGKYISSIYIKYQLDIKSRARDSHHEKIQLYLREEFLEYDEQ